MLAIGIYGIGEILWTMESSHGDVQVSQAQASLARIGVAAPESANNAASTGSMLPMLTLGIIGGYAPTQDLHDVCLMLLCGVVGYLLRKLEYPMAPAVFAIVPGPLAESSMRQSLHINHGNPMIFFERPISGPIMLVAIGLFLVPAVQAVRRRRAAQGA